MKKKLFIALPCHETVDPAFFLSCMNLKWAQTDASNVMVMPCMGDSAIGRARNTLTAQFLKTDATHLLFIDSDLVFDINHINRMLSHKEDLVGGSYFKKNETGMPQMVINTLADSPKTREDGLQEVKYVGTGFMMISRQVFETMIAEFGDQIAYTSDNTGETEYDFWHMGVYQYPDGKRRYLSEDWFFAQKWIDCGGKVWVDLRCILGHSGNIVYPTAQQREMAIKHDPIGKELQPA